MTYTRIGAILHEIGMVSEEQLHRTLAEAANYADEPLEEHDQAACALEEFGVAVSVHADDIDSIHYDYATLLADAVAVAGGRVAITDVRIVEGEGDVEGGRLDQLEFERDSKPVSILAAHLAEDYFDQGATCRGHSRDRPRRRPAPGAASASNANRTAATTASWSWPPPNRPKPSKPA